MIFRILAAAGAVGLWSGDTLAQTQDPCDASPAAPVLTLAEATNRARGADLRPEAIAAAVEAARAEARIAEYGPPDTVTLQTEDFPGIGLGEDVDNLQVTGSYNHTWERGGKKAARRAVASRGLEVARSALALTEAEIAYEVETLYLEAALATRRAEISCDRLAITTRLENEIRDRVQAARDPELAASRARADRLAAKGEVSRSRRLAAAQKAQLAAYWGGTGAFAVETAFLDEVQRAADDGMSIENAAQIRRLEAMEREAAALADLARAQAAPNVTWSVGVRNFGFEDDVALVTGISVPLRTGRRAEAAHAKAAAERRQAEAVTAAARQRLMREAMGYRRAAEDALLGLESLEAELLPEARRALDLAQSGYRRGAFTYLNVTDAQESLTALREDRLELLRTYYVNMAALRRLVAPGATAPDTESVQ
ncbi:metal ion efflux outer membrane factor protein family protein [Parvularcula bermudensis HTCC2503]|uniref:Metal ion efflux outer membrane factor protein family protein n=1 Tax=Parvularcula bermudensis (strain ATCC BAA-594 / HTCC2503 / KCTC 12087) TaxID=314260 RepID=E0TI17_PARBH|nr:TolC family protein [Parvularcula bermudensis]ADM10828.1 metal ion efflux outer membrane factor protein family protein [Parvularcula bermudensis HTCC2503]